MVIDSNADRSKAPSTKWMTKWIWKPGADSGITDPAGSWGLPDDARLRRNPATGQLYVLVTDSYGLLASIRYPQGGSVAWSVELGRGQNPHGIERLPNGNIAVAASTGSFVRVYAASQGQHAAHYAETTLTGAHEVFWDNRLRVLWAIADKELVKYQVTGTDDAPGLKPLASFGLPTNLGHDLQPVTGNEDRLWVTTRYGVYQFIKSTGTFDASYPREREISGSNVKSIGTDANSGTVLRTKPTQNNSCTWCTDRVTLYIGGSKTTSKVLAGSQIYRARWFDLNSN
jgi:hypothetical protein